MDAREYWEFREAKPEWFGAEKQLFNQIQDPATVLSELLQNADDAEAIIAFARIEQGEFLFEHNGKDFSAEEFASLCRFAFSNKRTIHTIGFRGIGFKSTFSLGDTVDLVSQSLAIRFEKDRFTQPLWQGIPNTENKTTIKVPLKDVNVETEITSSLIQWINSPASLLFFKNIEVLNIGQERLIRKVIGHGPVLNSNKIRLSGANDFEVIRFFSSDEHFPEDAIDEIRKERNIEDLHLPPCHVEIVLGIPNEQRLYVVLPTGYNLSLPFSCNAPFLQDPARTSIKRVSTSATNRWLLERIGRLAGESFLAWLANESLSVENRAEAYSLLPDSPDPSDPIVCSFMQVIERKPIILTAAGELAHKDECYAPPIGLYSIWSRDQLNEIFQNDGKAIASKHIDELTRKKLQNWNAIKLVDFDALFDILERKLAPKPDSESQLLELWKLVHSRLRYDSQVHNLSIVPVAGSKSMNDSEHVIRTRAREEGQSSFAWQFLSSFTPTLDPVWISFLANLEENSPDRDLANRILSAMGLNQASDKNKLVSIAVSRFYKQGNNANDELIKMAHCIASLDANLPDQMHYVTADGLWHGNSDTVLALRADELDGIVERDWCIEHCLNEGYFKLSEFCNRHQWQNWISSPKSGLHPFVPIRRSEDYLWGKGEVESLVKSRGVNSPIRYHKDHWNSFTIIDYQFEINHLEFWERTSHSDPYIWHRVIDLILNAPEWYWKESSVVEISQFNNNSYFYSIHTDPIPANWIAFFSSLPCLPDDQGIPRVPAELLLRTPDTEPYRGVYPFVKADYDNETTRPLLKALGVRDSPADVNKLIDRIKFLSEADDPNPLIHEICKWYEAIGSALLRCNTEEKLRARETFEYERLILTSAGDWVALGEVFREADPDEFEEVAVIHPAAQQLSLWNLLGVSNRPSYELIIDRLKQLKSGSKLDGPNQRRVTSALKQFPERIWDECGHWLTLDNSWSPVSNLNYRLTMGKLTKWGELYPQVKSLTANMTMLSRDILNHGEFSVLQDLVDVIEYRLIDNPYRLPDPEEKSWLRRLALLLLRVKHQDENIEARIHENAQELSEITWQPFQRINVAAYIDDEPAGFPITPDVFAADNILYVKQGSVVKLYEAITSELSSRFQLETIKDAFRACFERNIDFIDEYMENHFELEDTTPIRTRIQTSSRNDDEKEVDVMPGERITTEYQTDHIDLVDQDSVEESESPRDQDKSSVSSSTRPRQPSLIQSYAINKGYEPNLDGAKFSHTDGSIIIKADAPFQWQRINPAGEVMMRYWTTTQDLSGNGFEIGADLWNLLLSIQDNSAIILNVNGEPMMITGADLLKMKDKKKIDLFPAKYRLRMGMTDN
jgi:hypothetical protein